MPRRTHRTAHSDVLARRPLAPWRAAATTLAASVVAAALLVAAVPAQAQTVVKLVDNIQESADGFAFLFVGDQAQAFTTGTNEAGYTLTSIEIDYYFHEVANSVSLWSVSDGLPDLKIVDLSHPAGTAPSGTKLQKDTTYAVVVRGPDGFVWKTVSPNETGDAQAGWSIADVSRRTEFGKHRVWEDLILPSALKMQVNGIVDGESSDATLSALALQDDGDDTVALSPTPFTPAITEYTAWVADDVNSVTLTATSNDGDASVAITGNGATTTATEATIDLAEGANLLTVTVTAADGDTTRTYTVTVARAAAAPSADSGAIWTANLTVGSGTVSRRPILGDHAANGVGALAPRSFTHDSSTVTVEQFLYRTDRNRPSLRIAGTDTLATGEYVLDVGEMSFSVSHDGQSENIVIDDHGLDWSFGDVVLVKLTTVPGPPPLTAAFVSVPAEHDGETAFWLELGFDAAVVQGSKPHIRALLAVTGGTVKRIRRKDGRLDHWRIKIQPSSHEAVTVTLSPSPACGATGAVCTQDGRTYTSALATQIQGPPGLAVADAEVEEGPNASLAFAVTLSRAAASTVTVGYATSDGTATAGSDYTAASGTLTFAAGETEKTVSVAVLDDAHDEGSETLGLTLSNASGAHIADGTATGTINNTDHMPQAWLARFGRTVADQVVDAVGERLRGPGSAGAEVRVAGQDLSGATPNNEATREAEAQARIESLAKWLRGESEEDRQPLQSRTLTSRDFLTGTSFALTGGTAQTGFGSLWGRGALSRFDGREDELTLDGEVASAMLGADWTLGRGMAGLAVARSRGEGGYRASSRSARNRAPAGSGEVETTLTGLYPYGRYAVDERLTVWGVLGYGTGTLTLTPEGQPPMEADTDLAMAAAGVRGTVLRAPESGGMALAVRSDALAVRTTSETVPGPGGMKASEADVTRLRLGLEGSRAFRSGAGAALTPSLDIGVRHDGGDAETGFGVDIGAGLAWTDPASGMKAKVDARGLLTHEDGGFRERGIAGSLAWDPSPSSALGPSLTLRHSVGVSAAGGVSALLNPDTARRLAANDDDYKLERRRFEAVLGYGVPVLGDRFVGTPEIGVGVSDTGREVRLGWRLGLARGGERVSFTLGLEAARRESTDDDRGPEDRIAARLSMRW